MVHRFASISGFILAGGESRRMGEPKQELILHGESLLERQVTLLRRVCRSVAVVGPMGNRAWVQVHFLSDPLPGRGPLGGVHAALAASGAEYNLIVACDLPFLDARFLWLLARRALRSEADLTLAEDRSRRLVPLCAIYRKRIGGMIRGRLAQDSNKADGYFRNLRSCVMTWPEIVRAGFSTHIFDNINRPEDYEAARLRLGTF